MVASIDSRLAVSNITSLELLAQDAIAGQRTSTLVTAILGCLALLLASIGVYGVMAYTVSRRVREFGIRIALGSDRAGIVRLLFKGLLRLALVGIVLGARAGLRRAGMAELAVRRGEQQSGVAGARSPANVRSGGSCDAHSRAAGNARGTHRGIKKRVKNRVLNLLLARRSFFEMSELRMDRLDPPI